MECGGQSQIITGSTPLAQPLTTHSSRLPGRTTLRAGAASNGGAAFGLSSFGTTSLRSPNVALYHELSDDLCALAVRDIRQNLVELLGLRALGWIVDNSSVLVQAPEVESLDDVHDHEGRF